MFFPQLGFTAWSSNRSPGDVFVLLETLYGEIDRIATRRRIFKVETIGDWCVYLCSTVILRIGRSQRTSCSHSARILYLFPVMSLSPDYQVSLSFIMFVRFPQLYTYNADICINYPRMIQIPGKITLQKCFDSLEKLSRRAALFSMR